MKAPRILISIAALIGALTVAIPVPASAVAQEPASAGNEAQDRGWPRQFEAQGQEVVVQAPQVDEWPRFERITFRAAVSVAAKGSEERSWGVLRVSANTHIALQDRLVILTDRKLEGLTFPGVEPAEVERLKSIVVAAMPVERPQTVSLDRLVAALDPANADVRKVDVNLAPPKILTSNKPAILVMFMGKPRFKPVPNNDLLFAINTNWDVFLDPADNRYYLRNDKSWLVTADVDKGPWSSAASLPPSLSKLPSDENWSDVRAAIPGAQAKDIPVVYVTHEPAELIVTTGEPELEPISGTSLMAVANTESTIFYHSREKEFYFLAAGRWFKSGAVAGPWSAASSSLPVDFKKIPEDSDNADVLAAVPGTAAANEAIIMASIPEKATINRADVKIDVTYDGPPRFQPIESTTLQYASNSPYNVFMVGSRYYCCYNAVWFEAPSPNGAWTVCDSVPKAIYTIPPTSPFYNVTYVTVYESTPTTVVTGYTAGYSGATVAATGAVMFGLGIAVGAALEDNYSAYHYNPCYYSYGCGAYYHGAYGGFVSRSSYYGPYGGAGHAAAYNPATGVYSRAGYAYGPNGAAGYRTAYNPVTGRGATRAGGVSPYGSWGASAVTNGDKWATGSHRTTAAGTTGRVQTSSGAAAATAQGRYGNGATVARSQSGDYYAAHDGNVYKNTGGGWEQANRGSSGDARAQGYGAADQMERSNTAELQQQAEARNRGEQNAARASQFQGGGARWSPPAGGRRR